MAEKFHLVWTPGCEKSPKIQHSTYAEAKAAASAMANMNPGMRYYVLKCVSASGQATEPSPESTEA